MKKLLPIFFTFLYTQCFSQHNSLPEFWARQLDDIGVFHNESMEYAFNQCKTRDLSQIKTTDDVNKLVSTYVGDYCFKKYGSIQQFSLQDIQGFLYKTSYEPKDISTLQLSPMLTEAIRKIQYQLTIAGDPESFKRTAEEIGTVYDAKLNENEKIYLRGYQRITTSSFAYWSTNLGKWENLFSSRSKNPATTQRKKINAQSVVASDAGGLLSGAVSGCIGGTLFGAVVGCAVGGVFMGAVGASTASLGNIIGQLIFSLF